MSDRKPSALSPAALSEMAKLLRPNEAAERLSISPRSLWRLVAAGELKPVRLGRSVRFSVASLEALISRGGAS